MYRATTKDGEEVKGYWCVVEGRHFIIPEDAELTGGIGLKPKSITVDFLEIDPQTLAQDTTIKDKKG